MLVPRFPPLAVAELTNMMITGFPLVVIVAERFVTSVYEVLVDVNVPQEVLNVLFSFLLKFMFYSPHRFRSTNILVKNHFPVFVSPVAVAFL